MSLRGAVIIVQDGKLALIRRERQGRVYYVIPGGGVEPDETVEDAARREAREELGFDVRLGRLAAIIEAPRNERSEQHYFLAEIVGGEFGSGDGAELTELPKSERGTYTPVWLPLSDLASYDVYPREVALAVATGRISEQAAPLRFVIE